MLKNWTNFLYGSESKSLTNDGKFDGNDDLVEDNEWVLLKKPGEDDINKEFGDEICIPEEYLHDIYDADDENGKDDEKWQTRNSEGNVSIDNSRKKTKTIVYDDDDEEEEEEDSENKDNLNAIHKHFSKTLVASKRQTKSHLNKSVEELSLNRNLNESFSDDQQQHSDFESYRGPFWNLLDDTPLGRNGKVLSNASSQPEIANIPSLEECWVLSPAPIFTGEPRKCLKGSMEDLLIERTTKSVYNRYRIRSSASKSVESNDNDCNDSGKIYDQGTTNDKNKSDEDDKCEDVFDEEDENRRRMGLMTGKNRLSMFLSYFGKEAYDSNDDGELNDIYNSHVHDNGSNMNNIIAKEIIEIEDRQINLRDSQDYTD